MGNGQMAITPELLREWAGGDGPYRPAEISIEDHQALRHRTLVDIDLSDDQMALTCFDCGRVWPAQALDRRTLAFPESQKAFHLIRDRGDYRIIAGRTWDNLRRFCDISPLAAQGLRRGSNGDARIYAIRFERGNDRGYLVITPRRRFVFRAVK